MALRESIDLKHQVFEVGGVPAPHPYYHPENLVRTSWFENRRKRGGCGEVAQVVLAAIRANNAGVLVARNDTDTALAALTPLHAAQHTQRAADSSAKAEVIKVAKLVEAAFLDADSGVDLQMSDAAEHAQRGPVRVASGLRAYSLETEGADNDLDPHVTEQAKNGFIAFVSAFEIELQVSLRKNKRGFPMGPFAEDDDEDDILRLCGRALLCFLEECDEENEDDPNASPYAVLILVLVNEAELGLRDPLGGFLLDWSFSKHSPARPTVVAHCYLLRGTSAVDTVPAGHPRLGPAEDDGPRRGALHKLPDSLAFVCGTRQEDARDARMRGEDARSPRRPRSAS